MSVITSYGQPGGIGDRRAIMSASFNGFDADVLIDGSVVNPDYFVILANSTGGWIRFDFGDARIVDEIALLHNTTGTWGSVRVEGSNDASSWTALGTFTPSFASGQDVVTKLSFSNASGYRYYRILQLSDADGITLYEVLFKISPLCPLPVKTSYTYQGGTGDRTGAISISTTATLGGLANINLLINGVTGFVNQWFNSGQTNREIAFDFSLIGPQRITAFTWWQSSAVSHGGWVFEAFNEDLYDWVELVPEFTLGASARQEVTVDNLNYYLRYRLRQVSGTTSNTPFIQEIEFELGGLESQNAFELHDYGNAGGSGDRTSDITITANFTPLLGTINNLIDGQFDADALDAIAYANGATGSTITFDLTPIGAQAITEFRFFRNDEADDWGTWQFKGRNSTSDPWTLLGDPVKLGGTPRRYHSACNEVAYLYYQLEHVSGALSSTPWMLELEFRIGGEKPSNELIVTKITNQPIFGTHVIAEEGASLLFLPPLINANVLGAPAFEEAQPPYVNTMTTLS